MMARALRRAATRLAVLALGFALWLAPAGADYVPGRGAWDRYHFSLDQSRIRISLVDDILSGADFPDLLVPRAYVLFVSGAPPSTGGPLPPLLISNQVELLFVYGSGEPWSVAVAELARREKVTLAKAADILRPSQMSVILSSSRNPHALSDMRQRRQQSLQKQPSVFEGRPAYRNHNASSFHYYLGESEDEFFVARCHGPGERPSTHPTFQCQYWIDVADGVVADVTFLDFRMHGGRAFANARLNFARDFACRFLTAADCPKRRR